MIIVGNQLTIFVLNWGINSCNRPSGKANYHEPCVNLLCEPGKTVLTYHFQHLRGEKAIMKQDVDNVERNGRPICLQPGSNIG